MEVNDNATRRIRCSCESCVMPVFELLKYIIIMQHVICNLEMDTDVYCSNGTRNNSSVVLCMETDIQYDVQLFRTFY